MPPAVASLLVQASRQSYAGSPETLGNNMKNALITAMILGLVASCTTTDSPPEGLLRTTSETGRLNLTLGGKRYYGQYSMLILQKGSSFKATRFSAIALSTNEQLLDRTTVGCSDYGDELKYSNSFNDDLRNGRPVNVDEWQTRTSYLCGEHWYRFVPDRSVVVLSPDGNGLRALSVQLAPQSFSSKSKLAQAIKRQFTASPSQN